MLDVNAVSELQRSRSPQPLDMYLALGTCMLGLQMLEEGRGNTTQSRVSHCRTIEAGRVVPHSQQQLGDGLHLFHSRVCLMRHVPDQRAKACVSFGHKTTLDKAPGPC